ncbi:Crp/Fnr family transcriptional regulator [Agarilytica rhodophyticola]|uniref:Crp/Fnr family transcriptional regulator n=1 Tax=Agarilytica rhodophyticola TaxID=1737490 RepID=UPI000B348BC4|nr:Crp/Fnr family transcriptional regulator [Agarilytica rhodophyticola]
MSFFHPSMGNLGLKEDFFIAGDLRAQSIQFKKNDALFRPGDLSKAFLIITKGSVRVELTSRTGRDILLYRMSENQTCVLTTSALLSDQIYAARALAETDIEAVALPSDQFEKALRISDEFSQFVLRDYAQRVASLVSLIDRMTSRNIAAEMSKLLLEKCDANHCVSMTQEKIAKDIGSAREVIARKLSKLEAEQVIKKQRGKIIITDIDALSRYAKAC